MAHLKISKDSPLVCSVVTELQAAQVGKICQDYGIQAIINIKPFVEISQIKKAVKANLKKNYTTHVRAEVGGSLNFTATMILLRSIYDMRN